MSDHYDRYNGMENLLGTNLAEVGTEAITKQQAIDALRKLREEDIEDYGCEIPEGFNQDHLDRATFAIKQLPPIQPKRGRWEMGKDERFVECSECGLMTTRNELRGIAVFGKTNQTTVRTAEQRWR